MARLAGEARTVASAYGLEGTAQSGVGAERGLRSTTPRMRPASSLGVTNGRRGGGGTLPAPRRASDPAGECPVRGDGESGRAGPRSEGVERLRGPLNCLSLAVY